MTQRNEIDAPLTIDEVATLHRVSRRTVERWIRKGALSASKLPGGSVRIEPSDARAVVSPIVPVADSPQSVAGASSRPDAA